MPKKFGAHSILKIKSEVVFPHKRHYTLYMTKTTLPPICDHTITVIRGIEKAAKVILSIQGKIPAIIFLRECSGGARLQVFFKAYWRADYSYPTLPVVAGSNPTISMGLADGKQWMEMLERGESVLDGLVR